MPLAWTWQQQQQTKRQWCVHQGLFHALLGSSLGISNALGLNKAAAAAAASWASIDSAIFVHSLSISNALGLNTAAAAVATKRLSGVRTSVKFLPSWAAILLD
jgi:hypothetical protein